MAGSAENKYGRMKLGASHMNFWEGILKMKVKGVVMEKERRLYSLVLDPFNRVRPLIGMPISERRRYQIGAE